MKMILSNALSNKIITTRLMVAVAICLIAQSCSKTDRQFRELIVSPNDFDGRQIEITGVIHYRFEDCAIYLTKNSLKTEAIWIDYDRKAQLSDDGLDGQRITVTGQFDKNERGHLSQYVGVLKNTIIVIDK